MVNDNIIGEKIMKHKSSHKDDNAFVQIYRDYITCIIYKSNGSKVSLLNKPI